MRGRFFFLAVLMPLAVACPGEDAGTAGRMSVRRSTPDEVLVDAPARARYCASDTLLTIMSFGDRWNVALAMRTPWPLLRVYAVDSAVQGSGTAAIAARAVRDSVTRPLLGLTGTIELDSGDVLGGTFDIDVGPDSTRTKLTGRFSGLIADTTGCLHS